MPTAPANPRSNRLLAALAPADYERIAPNLEPAPMVLGKAILDGKESRIQPGDAVVVTPGTRHNFVNDGHEPLKIYTIYAPPNHIHGRIHETKADADADLADEEFGQAVR